jgi:MarR family transcriptional regulator, organic hydroperoxide resistance regulator
MSLSNRNRSPLHAEMIGQLRTFSSGAILFNQKVAERVGLHLTDMQCMNLLDLLGTSTPGKLAEFMGLTTGGVTVMLDRLEKTGCIRREPNPGDRRSVLVRVNARKMDKINAHYAGVADQLDAYVSTLPEAELETVVSFFKRINAIRLTAATGAAARSKKA